MIVMMSMGVCTSIWTISNFFKVMNASHGVIGTWVSNCILDVWGWWARILEGSDDSERLHTKYRDMAGCWKQV